MRVEIVAIGTELLLGQIQDTNSTWISERLAEVGVDCHFQSKVGDNLERIAESIRQSLSRADGVILCGGLGPTQDDITREAIAKVMGEELQVESEMVEKIRAYFASRNRQMPENNLRQAYKPKSAQFIDQRKGTAPGLICTVGPKVIYAVPGVPIEMRDMIGRSVIPDIVSRLGSASYIGSRVLRTWGFSESALAELVAPRLEILEESKRATIAFLASGAEGIKLRITAKGDTKEKVDLILKDEEEGLRSLLGENVFGVDEETMEYAVGERLKAKGYTLAVAESLTGGLISSRIVSVPGASQFFKGSVVSYATSVKREVLGVKSDEVVSKQAALEMAQGVMGVLGAEVGISTTGVAGPDAQEDQPVGTVWVGICISRADGLFKEAREFKFPSGDRATIRSLTAISLMDMLRRRLG
ncbi:MAG: competence/damage-inducible protein A [Acidimicrobiaceae bacterium]|nr:competence/damage-inducible protein A [Acidimicrobiaceae bacterium]